jgi:hypothetical protein
MLLRKWRWWRKINSFPGMGWVREWWRRWKGRWGWKLLPRNLLTRRGLWLQGGRSRCSSTRSDRCRWRLRRSIHPHFHFLRINKLGH